MKAVLRINQSSLLSAFFILEKHALQMFSSITKGDKGNFLGMKHAFVFNFANVNIGNQSNFGLCKVHIVLPEKQIE